MGYYGGVNYGFGYMGIGFVGGMWAGREFRYNTAVVNVNRTVIHNTYIDNTVVRNTTVVNDRHVAYSGGPGGINHRPTADEARFSREQHTAPTSLQTEHQAAARANLNNFASHNGGRPAEVATDRPMTGGAHGPAAGGNFNRPANPNTGNRDGQPENRGGTNPQYQPGGRGGGNSGAPTDKTYNASHSNTGNREAPQPTPHSQPQYQPRPESSRARVAAIATAPATPRISAAS